MLRVDSSRRDLLKRLFSAVSVNEIEWTVFEKVAVNGQCSFVLLSAGIALL